MITVILIMVVETLHLRRLSAVLWSRLICILKVRHRTIEVVGQFEPASDIALTLTWNTYGRESPGRNWYETIILQLYLITVQRIVLLHRPSTMLFTFGQNHLFILRR